MPLVSLHDLTCPLVLSFPHESRVSLEAWVRLALIVCKGGMLACQDAQDLWWPLSL